MADRDVPKAGTPMYLSWQNMKRRCLDHNFAGYHRSGGRGITFCDKWQSFAGFHEDMGDTYVAGLTLDRIDNNGNYSKGNCRWATQEEQANNRRDNRVFTLRGERKTLAQWIKSLGLKSSTVRQRFYVYGWPIERALGLEV